MWWMFSRLWWTFCFSYSWEFTHRKSPLFVGTQTPSANLIPPRRKALSLACRWLMRAWNNAKSFSVAMMDASGSPPNWFRRVMYTNMTKLELRNRRHFEGSQIWSFFAVVVEREFVGQCQSNQGQISHGGGAKRLSGKWDFLYLDTLVETSIGCRLMPAKAPPPMGCDHFLSRHSSLVANTP